MNFIEQTKQNNPDFFNFSSEICSMVIDKLEKTSNPQNILDFISKTVVKKVVISYFNRNSTYISKYTENKVLNKKIRESYLYTALCYYIHSTDRIPQITISSFTYNYSTVGFSSIDSPNFCKENAQTEFFKQESDKLRQARHRLLSSRPVYDKNTYWHTFPKSSITEWNLYNFFNNDVDSAKEWAAKNNLNTDNVSTLQDTFKRLKNLNNDVRKAMNMPCGTEYSDNLDVAYKKFSSKAKKITYDNFLALQKFIFDYIIQDELYYGINVYRLEKELCPYIITYTMQKLENAEFVMDRPIILHSYLTLYKIYFPKLYEELLNISNLNTTHFIIEYYFKMQDLIIFTINLIIDQLIERHILGDEWEKFLLDSINSMVDKVFYKPNDINYTSTQNSQKLF